MKSEPGLFRSKALKTGLITDKQGEELAAVEKKGPLAHNAKLLSLVRGGSEKSFHLLLETLTLMGEPFAEKCHELKQLLPQNGKKSLNYLLSCLFVCSGVCVCISSRYTARYCDSNITLSITHTHTEKYSIEG